MWLLKFHLEFSILCLITFYGFRTMFKQLLMDNGWIGNGEQKGDFKSLTAFFVPIMNVIIVILLFVMISIKKSDYEEMIKK